MNAAAPDATPGPSLGSEKMKAVVVTRTPARTKILFIKQIRAISGLGLMEAKQIAEMAPPYVLLLASEDVAGVLVESMERQLGERGMLEVYDAEPDLHPVIERPVTAATVLGPMGAGCATQAALLAAGAGLGLYLMG